MATMIQMLLDSMLESLQPCLLTSRRKNTDRLSRLSPSSILSATKRAILSPINSPEAPTSISTLPSRTLRCLPAATVLRLLVRLYMAAMSRWPLVNLATEAQNCNTGGLRGREAAIQITAHMTRSLLQTLRMVAGGLSTRPV